MAEGMKLQNNFPEWHRGSMTSVIKHRIPNYNRYKKIKSSKSKGKQSSHNVHYSCRKQRERWPREKNRDDVTHVDGEGKTRQDEDCEDRC